MLKKRKSFYTVWNCPKTWIKKSDIPKLIKLINSEESCASVVSSLSSALLENKTTIGK